MFYLMHTTNAMNKFCISDNLARVRISDNLLYSNPLHNMVSRIDGFCMVATLEENPNFLKFIDRAQFPVQFP